MRSLFLTAGFAVLALLLVSGCVGNTAGAGDEQKTVPEGQEKSVSGENHESMLTEEADVNVVDISFENDVYHSSEMMRFNVTVNSDAHMGDVTVSVTGISGKMDIEKTVNLSEGNNIISFEFGLPRCNVCGGISAGTHMIDAMVYYSGELVAEDSASVEIRQ